MKQALQLLGGLTPEHFVREYWQKKPLLVRGAVSGFLDPLSPQELAGLACEDHVEARLVLEHGGAKPWEVRHGPFQDRDFLDLPESHWTLLVQDVEKQIPDLADVLEPFRFVPDWRIDDLMVSYAPTSGSVGPHFDAYDVFLLQGQGRRRWQISSQSITPENIVLEAEIRIMRDFEAEQEWVLEQGDMLYLPPNVAHYGVALEPCMTYSIGFRAPSFREIVSGFSQFLLEDVDPNARYSDQEFSLQDNPGEISPQVLHTVKHLLRENLETDDDLIETWFGRFITEPKPQFNAEPSERSLVDVDLLAHLSGGGLLERNPGSRFAYVHHHSGESALFVDGQEFVLGPNVAFLAPLVCRQRVLDQRALQPAMEHPDALQLILDLTNEGYLVIYEDE